MTHDHHMMTKSTHHHETDQDLENHPALMSHSLAFHGGYKETILFYFWKIDSVGGIIGSMIGVFLMAALYEGLKYYRDFLFWRTYSEQQYQAAAVPPEKREEGRLKRPSRLSLPHAIQTAVYILQMIISYFLMLIFMTYNAWLCVATILGYGFGYFVFSWKKSILVDVTEPCH